MNKSLEKCFTGMTNVSEFTKVQLAVLAILNVLVMIGNVLINPLVIYILIITKQLNNMACKIIFNLTISDLLTSIFAQSLFIFKLNYKDCNLQKIHKL